MTNARQPEGATVMTTTTHLGHHLPSTRTAVALAAAVLLAAGAGYGVADVLLDDPRISAPASQIGGSDSTYNDVDRYPGFDPEKFAGTTREERALQHRG
jgi:hypothetical protein